jgi:hypothetical protein
MTVEQAELTVEGTDILTHSRMRALRSCPRKHEYAYEIGIRPADAAKALRMGTGVHAGIESHKKHKKPVGEAIAEAMAPYGVKPGWVQDESTTFEWDLEAETVRRLLAGWFWRWADTDLETVASEIEIEFPVINPETGRQARGYSGAVKIDEIVRLAGGQLAVLERKTAGESIDVASDYWRWLRIDPQVSMAVIAARQAGYDVSTVLYDVVRKPGIAPKAVSKADRTNADLTGKYCGEPAPSPCPERETVPMWGARLAQDMGERPEWYFNRVEIARTDDELEEFKHDLWDQYQALRGYKQRNHWPRNADSCMNMGRCSYFDICSSGRHLRRGDELPAGFVQLENVHPELSLSAGETP